MTPGICYVYEYNQSVKIRNVGFLKFAPKYQNIALQLHLRGIAVHPKTSAKLFVFYQQDDALIAKEILSVLCGDKSVSGNTTIPDSDFIPGKSVDEIGGFFLVTDSGHYYAAVPAGDAFNTAAIREWSPDSAEDAQESQEQEKEENLVKEPAQESVEKSVTTIEETTPPVPEESSPMESEPNEPPEAESGEAEVSASAEPGDPESGVSDESGGSLPDETDEAKPGEAEPESELHATCSTIEHTQSDTIKANQKRQASQTESFPKIRKIQRADLAILPRRCWNIANNSFLMHGYHNYHHLLLVEEDGHFWVGVPGIYSPREAKAAELFGFSQFTKTYADYLNLENEEKDSSDQFGHWCRFMR